MGAMRAILKAGQRIPEDVAIIGCGNVNYIDLLPVPCPALVKKRRWNTQVCSQLS
jgi:LacI family transcriptional regulator